MSAQVIGAIAPWFGAKRAIGGLIAGEIGPHSVYWEVPCGSMAVLLSMPPCKAETVVELHGDLVNLGRVIQHPALGPKLYRRLRRAWSSESEFRDALAVVRSAECDPATPDVDRAFAYFVASWQGMNGVAGTSEFNTSFCRRFSSTGGDPGARWAGAVRSIPAWRRRLERVTIIHGDMFDILGKIADRPGTAIYCDPPYLEKGARYKHDFRREMPDDPHPLVRKFGDHGRLALALRRFESARVVVSYYDHPALAELCPGWNVRRLDAAKNMVNSGKAGRDGRVDAPEVLLVNGPLASAPRSSLFD